jgi:hypothetical protein
MSLPDISLQFDSDAPLSSFFDVEAAVFPDPEIRPGPVEALVAARGETVILVRCLTPEFDDYDSLDPTASTWDLRLVKALVSSPREKEARRPRRRGITATKRAALGEYLRPRSDREGNGDLIVEVPDARVLGVSGSGASWDVTLQYPDRDAADYGAGGSLPISVQIDTPITGTYSLDFTGGTPAITGLNRDEYRVHRIAEVRRDRHPFTGVTKLSVYLQEVVGR